MSLCLHPVDGDEGWVAPRAASLALAALLACGCRSDQAPTTAPTTKVAVEAEPAVEAGPRRLSQLVLSDRNACVIDDGRRVLCWGIDVGEPGRAADDRIAQVIDYELERERDYELELERELGLELGEAPTTIRQLSLDHGENVCALFDDGRRRCLPLGKPDASPRSGPVPDGIVTVMDNDFERCMLGQDRTLLCDDESKPDVIDFELDSFAYGCALVDEGRLWKWSGDLRRAESIGPVPGAVQVESPHLPCVRTAAGEVWCWYLVFILEPDTASGAPSSRPTFELLPSSSGEPILDLDREFYRLCVIEQDGDVWCRGRNESGQLGAGDTKPHASEVAVSLPGPAREIEVERDHNCAIVNEGVDDRVWCWGEHRTRARETVVLPLETRALHLSGNVSCATTSAGQLLCWGERMMRLLTAQGDDEHDAQPLPVWTARSRVDDYVAEFGPDSALLSGDELVYGWRLVTGDGQPDDSSVLLRRRGVASFVLSRNALCTLDSAGTLECWVPSRLDGGQGSDPVRTPRIPTRSGVTGASAKHHEVCAVARGEVACASTTAEQGQGWRAIPGITHAVDVADHPQGELTCALLEDGGVRCWKGMHRPEGYVVETPPFALDIDDAVEIVVGLFGVCARTEVGAVRCGEIDSVPALAVELDAGAVELDAGDDHWCARIDADADGRSEALECHGSNVLGQLGKLGEHVMLTPTAITLPPRAQP